MTSHERVLMLAAGRLDFDPEPAQERTLREHLASCDACARRAALMVDDLRRIERLPTHAVPAQVGERVLRAIAPARRMPLRPALVLALVLLLLSALAGALAAGALLRYLQDPRLPGPDRLPTAELAYGGPWLASNIDPQAGWLPLHVASLGGEFVASGLRLDAGAPDGLSGALWTSAEGRDWAMTGADALPAGTTPVGAAAGKGGWLVAANTSADGGAADGAVLRSADGVSWTPAGDTGALANHQLSGLAAGQFGYLVVGHRSACIAPPDCPPRTALFGSADGAAWQLLHGSDVSLPASAEIRAIAATEERALAVGFAQLEDGVRSIVWEIDTRVEPWAVSVRQDPPGLEQAMLIGVAPVDGGWLVAAQGHGPAAGLFHSIDGERWSGRATPVPAFDGFVGSGGLLIAWSLADADGDTPPNEIGMWLSGDQGESWMRREPWSEFFAPTSVAVDDAGVIVATSAPRPRDPVPPIWLLLPSATSGY